jgi:hypothetical protein
LLSDDIYILPPDADEEYLFRMTHLLFSKYGPAILQQLIHIISSCDQYDCRVQHAMRILCYILEYSDGLSEQDSDDLCSMLPDIRLQDILIIDLYFLCLSYAHSLHYRDNQSISRIYNTVYSISSKNTNISSLYNSIVNKMKLKKMCVENIGKLLIVPEDICIEFQRHELSRRVGYDSKFKDSVELILSIGMCMYMEYYNKKKYGQEAFSVDVEYCYYIPPLFNKFVSATLICTWSNTCGLYTLQKPHLSII